ncbi:hypothetical protein [Actomonas aquatica]|uniref:Uncharacterized protein n=1 Tax=Actomonas aquatica TaxID=2866162 RepID=A0ABZ1C724_9BACT|nr:hypothetical protein [Opitutus sp. WL0086]WRQ87256.1 hypothetical protein K1X11_020780 [Opitutus sp. WL0086]
MCAEQIIVLHELPAIEKIVRDETWLEGERRGCWVDPHDPVVSENVCAIIMRLGAMMREQVQREHPELAA